MKRAAPSRRGWTLLGILTLLIVVLFVHSRNPWCAALLGLVAPLWLAELAGRGRRFARHGIIVATVCLPNPERADLRTDWLTVLDSPEEVPHPIDFMLDILMGIPPIAWTAWSQRGVSSKLTGRGKLQTLALFAPYLMVSLLVLVMVRNVDTWAKLSVAAGPLFGAWTAASRIEIRKAEIRRQCWTTAALCSPPSVLIGVEHRTLALSLLIGSVVLVGIGWAAAAKGLRPSAAAAVLAASMCSLSMLGMVVDPSWWLVTGAMVVWITGCWLAAMVGMGEASPLVAAVGGLLLTLMMGGEAWALSEGIEHRLAVAIGAVAATGLLIFLEWRFVLGAWAAPRRLKDEIAILMRKGRIDDADMRRLDELEGWVPAFSLPALQLHWRLVGHPGGPITDPECLALISRARERVEHLPVGLEIYEAYDRLRMSEGMHRMMRRHLLGMQAEEAEQLPGTACA